MRRARQASYFAILLAGLVAGCQPPGPKALLEGDRLIREGRFDEAIPRLQRATELLPANPMAWNFLGLAYHHGGRPEEALRAYQQAVTLDRNLAVIRYNLGVLHLEQGRAAEAISELTTATVLDQNSAPGWLQLGKAQLLSKRIDEAQRSLETARKLEPKNPETLNYLGVTELHRRRTRDAISYFNAALQENPDFAPAVLNQAIFYHYYVVNKTNALQKYKDYLELGPDAAGLTRATEAVRQLENELAPKPAPVAVVTTNRPVTVATNLARTNMLAVSTNLPRTNELALATNRAPKVETNRPVVIVTNQPSTNMPVAIATNVIVTNRPVAAAPPRKVEATNAPPKVAEVPKPAEKPVETKVAEAPPQKAAPEPTPKVEEPKPEPPPKLEVVKVDEEPVIIAAKDPAPPVATPKPEPVATNAPAPPVQVAIAKRAEEEPKPATPTPLIRPVEPEDKSRIAQTLEKLDPRAWFKREKKEKPREVAAAPEPAAKAEPAAPSNASALEYLPEPPAKTPEPEPVVFKGPRYPYRNATAPAAGNRQAAETPFFEAVEHHRARRLGAAMDGYRQAIRLDPSFFEAHLNLGLAASQSGDLPLALASLEDTVRMKPDSIEARYHFALALQRANYPQDAIVELNEVISRAPEEARAYLALANLYAQTLNAPGQAEPHYRKVIALQPNHPQAAQIRAWLAQR